MIVVALLAEVVDADDPTRIVTNLLLGLYQYEIDAADALEASPYHFRHEATALADVSPDSTVSFIIKEFDV